ncbi:MAG: LysM peptidoglycan-binding domain-containing protein [Desulfocapsa sp.]|nr:LysM peptidoglycan-binding domain-containing protein [Desulfocapsa sp.]
MQKNTFLKYFIPKILPSVKLRFLLTSLFLTLLLQPSALLGADPFPQYPVINKNVRFWENIYSKYSTSQAVVHDSNNLGIIYEVLPIYNHRLPGSSKINKPILKGIKNKYSHILNRLAKGIQPKTSDEKRVAALYAKSSKKQFKKAADSVRIQIGQKDRFIEGVRRSGAYMKKIKHIFVKQGLPSDLAYLPHVESSFNIKAYSKFGASGIWQFTRPTGQQFLTINYAIDERQDPILASHAAAKFLKKNYESLGSWPLAITAYNYGPAGMRRAKKAHSSYEEIFRHYNQGYFKFASRNFYSEFLAAMHIAKKLEKDPSIKQNKPLNILKFTLPAYISANDLCKHFNLSKNTLKQYNPALRRSVLDGKKYIPKGYTLLLPHTNRQKTLLSQLPSRLYYSKQKPTKFHRVRPGDTAGKIAQKYKVSLKSLLSSNNLGNNATIFVGQNLRIPFTATRSGKASNIRSTQHKLTKRPATKSSQSVTESIPTLTDTKKRKPKWQNIQKARSVVLGELGVQKISKNTGPPQGKITVLPEESIELLASWLKISATALRKLNRFSKTRTLHPDEKIKISLINTSAKHFEEKRFDFHLETEEDFFSAYKIVGVSSYEVKKGDTIWEICKKKFDLPLWLLKKYNTNLNFSSLHASQRLTIPIVKAI